MRRHSVFIALSVVAALTLRAWGVEPADDLRAAFSHPPASAKPWVYWFWLNGNITREGITADLEAMQRAGIGGVLIMEVDQGVPQGPVDFMGPQWREMFKHVVAEAGRLGLEVNMNNDAGWNGSGGPWIKPEQSMQKVVWTETAVEGGKHFDGALAQPAPTAGFYRDISVLAFPTVGAYRIEEIEQRACFKTGFISPTIPADVPKEMTIDRTAIVDLSTRMDKDGHIAWDAPAGNWTVMRFGCTSTGVENAPAPATGRGLECDKLSMEGIEANFNGMMGKLIQDVGPAAGKALIATHIDSWENGAQNWTAHMREEFQKRRGYDLMPLLPVMSGRVIGSREISERFLWDLRQTVSDLVVDYYAGGLQKLAHDHGMKLTIEAYGGPCDDMPYAARADEPMSEFWVGGNALSVCKEMASSAHTNGKRILGAESFTADNNERWLEYPGTLKSLADRAFCLGVNRFVVHRYAMQPWIDRRPGMTMGPWGVHYERTETWWDMTPAWHDYVSRCQHVLRQGLFFADICYLQPETAPQGFQEHHREGYDYDNCGVDVVLNRMSVKDGRIVLPDGMNYRLLVLPEVPTMTPKLVHKIKELVQAGATIIGPRPQKSPSLTDYPACDDDVQKTAGELWGDCDGKAVKEHAFGQGRIIWGITPEEVLSKAGVRADFVNGERLESIHRVVDDKDVYFVANSRPRAVTATCTFRMSGKRPEFWNPVTGTTELASPYAEKDGVISVVVPLGPRGSVFVVFTKNESSVDQAVTIARNGEPILSAVGTGPKVVVQKAVYGVIDDPKRSRDVHDKVQALVNGGEYSFNVSRLAEGGDPAPETLKSVVIEYSVGNKTFKVKGNDTDVVYLTGDTAPIVVEKAVYGILDDPKRTRDVQQKVQHIVDTGEMGFQVARLAQGDDPAVNVVKTAVIDYTVNGKHMSATGTDSDRITLYEASGSEKSVDVRGVANGGTEIEAWKPGVYEAKTAGGKTIRLDASTLPAPIDVAGPWEIAFPPNWGAPATVKFDKLISWSEHTDPGVKYFSGIGTYTTTVNVSNEIRAKDRRIYLDLGDVQVMAQVRLNGKDLGTLWEAPYLVDVTDTIQPGVNTLQVKVANLWVNRLIGDEQLPDDSVRNPEGTLKEWPQWVNGSQPSPTGRFTFTTWRLWKKGEPLQKSGLLGPVRLVATITHVE